LSGLEPAFAVALALVVEVVVAEVMLGEPVAVAPAVVPDPLVAVALPGPANFVHKPTAALLFSTSRE
jgi:hypothetical protein